MTAELVLHLELNGFEVVDQKEAVKDVSDKKHEGTIHGRVDIVADDTFGACASFDGSTSNYISVPSDNFLKITGDVTVEAWVYITSAPAAWVRVIGKGTVDSRSYGLWYKMTGTTTTWLFQRGHGKSFHDCEAVFTLPTATLNTWYHLAGVVEGKKSSIYVHDLQGKLIAQGELDNAPSGTALDNDSHVTIAHAPSMHYAHSGKIAHARIYKGSLSEERIKRDISSDRLALVPFRKSHPIDFRLYDDDDQAVLYITDDPAGHNLHLELHNTSTQIIQLRNPQGAGASEANHHFAVRFRPGTLSKSTLKALVDSQKRATILNQDPVEWELYFSPTLPAANEVASLYLLYKGAATTFEPNKRRMLTLQRMSAAPGSGARGTQVELLPHQLTAAAAGGDDATPITGSRTQYVHITNQIGHKNIPLHVWFEGGNTVLNDGVSSTPLTLCIGNGSVDRDITLNATSKFLISFDVGDGVDAAWALTASKHESNVSVKSGGTELPLTAAGQGISRQWSLQFPKGQVLPKRGSAGAGPLKISIEGIQTSPQASGHANLYVRYEGIPGYQDGQFILTVEKSPLVSHQGCVGIGTPEPKAKLEIALDDKDTTTNPLMIGKGATNYLTIRNNGNVGIGTTDPNAALQIGNFAPQDTYLKVTAMGGSKYRAGIKLECWKDNRGYSIEFDERNHPRAGLKFTRHEPDPISPRTDLFLDLATGNVGIGTGLPEAKLEIALEDKDTTTHPVVVRRGTTNYLTIHYDGNVSIGTTDPKVPLKREIEGVRGTYLKVSSAEDGWSRSQAGIKLECGQQNDGYSIEFDSGNLAPPGLKFTRYRGSDEPRIDFFLNRETGYVGIGTSTPEKKLQVMNGSLEVTATHNHSKLDNPDAADIGTFCTKDKIQGIGISSNRIAAIGTSPDSRHRQHIFIKPKGHGSVVIEGPLRGANGPLQVNGALQVNGILQINGGLPIFDYGMRLTPEQQRDYVQKLKASYHPGCFILFVREDSSDDICCLVKKSNNEVRLLTFYCSSNNLA